MWQNKGIVNETIPNPAAGADWVHTVILRQGIAARRLIAAFGIYTSGGAAANREVNLQMDDGSAAVVVESLAPVVIVASQTRRLQWALNFGLLSTSGVAANQIHTSLADGMYLFPGFRVRATTLNIQAADQWSAVRLVFEEWG
jgi:hypothetical protein